MLLTQQRHETRPVDASPQPAHMVHINAVPPAKGGRSYFPPEWASREQLATSAALALADASLPQVHDLPGRTDAGKLSEQSFEQSAAATAKARQIEEPWGFADDVPPDAETRRPGGRPASDVRADGRERRSRASETIRTSIVQAIT
jgi:hypothetical protein